MRKLNYKLLLPLIVMANTHLLFGASRSSVEFRSAAFFPSSERFRDIYGTAGVDYQFEASTKIYHYLDGWANFDWFSKHGKSIGLHDSTRISIANTSFGVKFPYQFHKNFVFYVGIGPSFSRVWLKNKTPCSHQHISKWAFGGVLKMGIYFLFGNRYFVDVFVDYLYQPTNFKTHVDIGGVKTGAGLGVKF